MHFSKQLNHCRFFPHQIQPLLEAQIYSSFCKGLVTLWTTDHPKKRFASRKKVFLANLKICSKGYFFLHKKEANKIYTGLVIQWANGHPKREIRFKKDERLFSMLGIQNYKLKFALDSFLVSTTPLCVKKLYYLVVTSTQTFETCVSREESNSNPKWFSPKL